MKRKTRYCEECEKAITSTWIGDTEYCSVCGCDYMFSIGEYDCPGCGFFDEEPAPENVIYGRQHYNNYVTMEYGVTAYDWEENHTCPICNTIYLFSNSNC